MLATLLLLACLDETARGPSVEEDHAGRAAQYPTMDGEPIPLCINEFMPDTRASALDELGVASDWIELHNPTEVDVSLEGWSITDDPAEPRKHRLGGDLVVEAGGFLVLWADGDPAGRPDHLGFALDDDGEAVALFGPDESGSIVWFGPVANDLAVKRLTDCCTDEEEGCFGYAFAGTPGTTNTEP